MTLDPILLEVLVCPVDKGPLRWIQTEALLYNPRLRRAYRVKDGIPVMLVEESVEVDDAEHRRLTEAADAQGAPWTGPQGDGDRSEEGGGT